jgi:hypothetical protein
VTLKAMLDRDRRTYGTIHDMICPLALVFGIQAVGVVAEN